MIEGYKDLERREKDGVVWYVSPDIKAPHGFSTRLGGVSVIPHLAAMNLGRKLGDDPDAVEENYRRFCAAAGIDKNALVYTDQVHSPDVVTVTAADAGRVITCDGLVTRSPGTAVSVRTADCVPILFWSPAGVIGACHAGWRGTVSGVQINTVRAMEALGAAPD